MTIAVNDRVALTADYEGLPVGTLGTVVRIQPVQDFPYFVKFDQPFPDQFTDEEREILAFLGGDPDEFIYGASMATDQIVALA